MKIAKSKGSSSAAGIVVVDRRQASPEEIKTYRTVTDQDMLEVDLDQSSLLRRDNRLWASINISD